MITRKEKIDIIKKAIEALNRNYGYEMRVVEFREGTGADGDRYLTAVIANGPRGKDQPLSFDDEWFSVDFDENLDRYTAMAENIKSELKYANPEVRPVLKVMGVIWFYAGLCLNTK